MNGLAVGGKNGRPEVDVVKSRELMQKYVPDEHAGARWKRGRPLNRRACSTSSFSSEDDSHAGNDIIHRLSQAQPPPSSPIAHTLREIGAAVFLRWPGHWANGQVGRLATYMRSGDVRVILSAALGHPEVWVPASVIQPLPLGCLAEVIGPTWEKRSPDKKRRGGRIACFENDTGQYSLRLPKSPDSSGLVESEWSGSTIGARMVPSSPVDLAPHRLLDVPIGINGASGCGSEHRCRFVDDNGRVHKFVMYLPPKFDSKGTRWPLLLFLHGSQGGTVIGPRLKAKSMNKDMKWAPGSDFVG